MPAVIAAAATAAGAGATAAAAIGQIGFAVIVTGASFAAQSLLAPDNQAVNFDPIGGGGQATLGQDEGRKIVSKQAVPLRKFVYGQALVGGPLFFLEQANPYVYFGIINSDGPIEGVQETRIGGTTVLFDLNGDATTFPWRDGSTVRFSASFRDGSDDQSIDPILAADWPALPSTYRQRGIATSVLKMHYGADRDEHELLWPATGINPIFLVKGQKMYDPRDPFQSETDKTTWLWSDNPSLCVAHYLTNKWRRPISFDDIDVPSLIDAANIDDESIGLAGGGTEKRYTCNGVVTADQSDFDVVSKMLSANNGILLFRKGKYEIRSGAFRPATFPTITDGMIKGAMSVRHDVPVREALNKVRTTFVAPDREYQNANGPIVENAVYLALDGRTNETTLDMPFNDSAARAQRLAKQRMEISRRGRLVTMPIGKLGQVLEADDVVNIELATLPKANGLYRVDNWDFDGSLANVQFRQHDADSFAWDPSTDEQAFTIAPAEL